MAWIESHQELRHHPKLGHVCQLLGADVAHMTGHLHFLWWWCMDYAMDGDVSKYNAKQLADAAGWHENAEKFLKALVDSKFIDVSGKSMKIHDWYMFCGDLVKKRLEYRSQKTQRMKRIGNSQRISENSQRKFPVSQRISENSQPTNTTIPNHTIPTIPNHLKTTTPRRKTFEKPEAFMVTSYGQSIGFNLDGQKFVDYYESKGWMVGKSPMRDWKACVRTWKNNGYGGIYAQQRNDESGNQEAGANGAPKVSKFDGLSKEISL